MCLLFSICAGYQYPPPHLEARLPSEFLGDRDSIFLWKIPGKFPELPFSPLCSAEITPAVLISVSPEQNPNFFPKQSERELICAPRPLPSVAGAKTKNFPYLSYFPRRGVWGGATKNGKEIFGFCFADSINTSYNNLEYNATEYYNTNT